jgi:Raf kinase inhibitor-like YbhB/YbcL family protein
MAFVLKSPVLPNNGVIEKKYTCDGTDVSIPLSWTDPPEETKSFALIVDDPDAPSGTWVHWVLYDLPAVTRELPEGIRPVKILDDGSKQGINDFRRVGYGGPCPPPGPAHHYVFTLYALNRETLRLQAGAARQQLLHAMQGHTLAQAKLTGLYKR